MPDFSMFEWVFVLAAAFCSGFLVRTFGAGVGLVITPFLISAFSPTFSLGLIALFSCWSGLGAAPDFWGKWNLRYVFLLAPGIIIGLAVGVWLLTWLPGAGLKLLIGAICLCLASYQTLVEIRGRPFEIPPMPAWQGGGFGVMSGLCSSLANSGAIFLTPVLISQKLEKITLVSTIWALLCGDEPHQGGRLLAGIRRDDGYRLGERGRPARAVAGHQDGRMGAGQAERTHLQPVRAEHRSRRIDTSAVRLVHLRFSFSRAKIQRHRMEER